MRSLVFIAALVLACASSTASAWRCSFPRTSTGDIDREAIEQDARDDDGFPTVARWSGHYRCTSFPGQGELTQSELAYLQNRLLKRRGKTDWSMAEGRDYVCVTSRIGATTCFSDTLAP